MFARILVPLDGSILAERAIPVAARIARAAGDTVVLLRVIGIPNAYGPYLYQPYASQAPVFAQEILDAEQAKAEYYLRDVARSECLEDVRVEMKAYSGTAAATILEMAQLMHVDLIVMSSHGRTGFKRWALGSVAQKVARHCPLPVLLLREGSPQTLDRHANRRGPLRALVALDGSPFSEAALLPAAQLITALAAPGQAALHLTQVVKRQLAGSKEVYEVSVDEEEQAMQGAANYLSSIAENVHKRQIAVPELSVTWSVVAKEDVAGTLIRMAELGEDMSMADVQACGLIAMATHGWGGLRHRMAGSVTGRVLDGTTLPLLIVHPQQQHAAITNEATGQAAASAGSRNL
jgi:nucleotide-binding universal stress UspA family protein